MINLGSIDPEKAKLLEVPEEILHGLEELQEEVCNFCGEDKPAFFTVWAKWQDHAIAFQLCEDCTVEQLSGNFLVTQAYKQLQKVYPWIKIGGGNNDG